VAHAYNPSYSGVTDQEDRGLKPAQANSSRDPISKKLSTKKRWWRGQGVGPEIKPQFCKETSPPQRKPQQKPSLFSKERIFGTNHCTK
jgi:hypothetical protein